MPKIDLLESHQLPKTIFFDSRDPVELFKLANQMEKICLENQGIGLSAVQVGVPWNFFIVQRDSKFEHYFNCSYQGNNELVDSIEGCLSLKNKDNSFRRFKLKRHSQISIKGNILTESNGKIILKPFESHESGLYGIVFQHEIDHALGTMISDIGTEIFVS